MHGANISRGLQEPFPCDRGSGCLRNGRLGVIGPSQDGPWPGLRRGRVLARSCPGVKAACIVPHKCQHRSKQATGPGWPDVPPAARPDVTWLESGFSKSLVGRVAGCSRDIPGSLGRACPLRLRGQRAGCVRAPGHQQDMGGGGRDRRSAWHWGGPHTNLSFQPTEALSR